MANKRKAKARKARAYLRKKAFTMLNDLLDPATRNRKNFDWLFLYTIQEIARYYTAKEAEIEAAGKRWQAEVKN